MLKTKNVFTYLFIMIIVVLIVIPIVWTKYGNRLINEVYYHDFEYTSDVELITNNEDTILLDYNSHGTGEMFVHLIYEDYEKSILEFNIVDGNNKITIKKKDKNIKNIYVFYISKDIEHKWIILEM